MNNSILFEDNHLLIVNKPSGILSQGDKSGDSTILDRYKNYIKQKYNKPGNVFLAPAHRIDRPVSGCLILGRTSKGLSRITEQFRQNKVDKTYIALTEKMPEQLDGRLVHSIEKNKSTNKSFIRKGEKGKRSVLNYHVIGNINSVVLLRINPETGRSHQIRIQLSTIGCPIIGDTKYGSRVDYVDKSIALHCYRMQFTHPITQDLISIQCDPHWSNDWGKIKSLLSSV